MQTAEAVIDEFGGYAKLAEAIGAPPGTVSAWKSRDSIPAEYWKRIVDAAAARGIALTYEGLASIADRKGRAPAPQPAEAAE